MNVADDQRHVPDLQHPALLLDHRSSAGTRCRPATASATRSRPGPSPSSRPSRARSRTSSAPSRIPKPRNVQAISAKRRVERIQSASGAPRDQRADRERERDREADVARVEHRRVEHHRRVAQQRVEPVALGRRVGERRRTGSPLKTISAQEEGGDRAEHRGRVRHDLAVARGASTSSTALEKSDSSQTHSSSEPGLARPHRGELVEGRRVGRRVAARRGRTRSPSAGRRLEDHRGADHQRRRARRSRGAPRRPTGAGRVRAP